MTASSEHLFDKAASLIAAPVRERISYVNEDKWIGYPKAQDIIDQLEDLMVYPKSDRMPNLLIIGDSNNGKTNILRRFSNRYPVDIDEETGSALQPLVMVSAPSKPEESGLYIRLLEQMMVPYSKNESVQVKAQKVIRTMSIRKTRMIIIDEIQHLIAGSLNSQRTFLNGLKDLSNTLKIPIVGAGIEDAFHAIQIDAQLANRFKVEVLERWKFNSKDTRQNFARLVISIEKRLPLAEPSYLYKQPNIERIYDWSEGLIGEAVSVIKQLAVYAIKNDLPKIDEIVFDSVKIVPPSKRRDLLKKLR